MGWWNRLLDLGGVAVKPVEFFYINEIFSNVERPWEGRVEGRWGSTEWELIWGQGLLTRASTATEQQGAPENPVSFCCQQAAACKQQFSSPVIRERPERPTWTILPYMNNNISDCSGIYSDYLLPSAISVFLRNLHVFKEEKKRQETH